MLLQAWPGHRVDRRTGEGAFCAYIMLRLKKIAASKNWYVRGTVAGVQLFESTGTADKSLAEQYRVKREREVYEEAALGKVRPATFADAVSAYLEHGKQGRFLTPLLDHFKETPLSEIGQAEIDAAANAIYPRAKASTLNRQVYGPTIAVLRHAVRRQAGRGGNPACEVSQGAAACGDACG